MTILTIGMLKKVYVRGTTPSILHLYALTGWGPNFRGLCSRTLSRPLWWYFAFYLATSRPMFTDQLLVMFSLYFEKSTPCLY